LRLFYVQSHHNRRRYRGLAAAVHLKAGAKAHGKVVDVLLLERNQRIGGKILTEKIGDYLVEAGPDSFLPRRSGP